MNAQVISSVAAICMALIVLSIRMKASNQPTSPKKIIIPPLGMSTGFLMFIAPQTHIPWAYAVAAFLVGVLFSYPLIVSSQMVVRRGEVYLRRSKAFVVIILGLLVIRIALHSYVEHYITYMQTGAVFFILAFGMLLPWRIAMLYKYQRLTRPSR